jgi:type I restriction enzyme S subunit
MKSTKIYDSQDKITLEAVENSSAKLIQPGSLLFVVRSGIIQRILPLASLKVVAAINQDLKALTPIKGVDEDYLLHSTLALAENIRNDCSKDGTTVQSIEFKSLKEFLLPLPPFAEQQKIVQEVERIISALSDIESSIFINLRQTDRLRQSILKRAFKGKLVPQDPNDELASVLLDRIMAEKAGQVKTTRGSKKNSTQQMRLINVQ